MLHIYNNSRFSIKVTEQTSFARTGSTGTRLHRNEAVNREMEVLVAHLSSWVAGNKWDSHPADTDTQSPAYCSIQSAANRMLHWTCFTYQWKKINYLNDQPTITLQIRNVPSTFNSCFPDEPGLAAPPPRVFSFNCSRGKSLKLVAQTSYRPHVLPVIQLTVTKHLSKFNGRGHFLD